MTIPPAAELAIKAALKNGAKGPSLMQLADATVTGTLTVEGLTGNLFDPANALVMIPPSFGNSGGPGAHQNVPINENTEFVVIIKPGVDSVVSACDISPSGVVTCATLNHLHRLLGQQ